MFEPSEIITGQNLSDRCDYSFSRMIDADGNGVPQFSNYFPKLSGGELLFCKTDFVPHLASVVEKYVPRNIHFKLITHDSDYPVTDSLMSVFNGRPITWFGMNCETAQANPIPIGIANSYCKITLKHKDFCGSVNPQRLLYVNHRVETNSEHRAWLYPHFSNMKWATVRHPHPKGEVEAYKKELLDHKFVLCPRGNGVDTHRMWEALYSGVIPVVVRHRTHSMLEGNLPILFVNHYSEVTEQMLTDVHEKYREKNWNMDMLKVSWWINKMRGANHAN